MRLEVNKPIFQAVKTACDPVPVRDHIVEDGQLPDVIVRPSLENEWGTDTETGADLEFTVACWSKLRGWREAAQLYKKVLTALDRVPLDLEEGHCVTCHFLRAQAVEDPDGIRRQIIATFRVLVDYA